MNIVISAGPTREKIDAVRFLSNRSTGKMGYAIAAAAASLGHRVTLVSGPVTLPPPPGVTLRRVESAADMAAAMHETAPDGDVVIMAAAVADYRPVNPVANKMKKASGNLFLELERTEDILQSLGQAKRPGQLLVGFAAETDDLTANALGKLNRKNLDWIVANDVSRSDRGFGADTNAVTLFCHDGRRIDLPLADKTAIAKQILEYILP
jgi:phosphopantothenoylcysteine decarboxylase/phosphopantothenate--cysteine ligase